MGHDVCPWWLGYWLASPIRKLRHDPLQILSPYIREGMTVYEPGPGMGFFTLPMAQLVGPKGRIVAVDVQARMLSVLLRKAARKGIADRIEARLAGPGGHGIDDLHGRVDFVLAFAVIHELPDQTGFFKDSFASLKHGGRLLFSEPANHVGETDFRRSVEYARQAGFRVERAPIVKSNRTALLIKMQAQAQSPGSAL